MQVAHNSQNSKQAKSALPLVLTASLIGIAAFYALSFAPEPIKSHRELFREGAITTLYLTFLSSFFGLAIGMLTGWVRFFDTPVLKWIAKVYLEVIRGTPLLVQILFVYYAVPSLFPKLPLNEFWAATIALSLNVGAYHAEVIRAGMTAIPHGQWECSRTLGLGQWQTFQWVIWPQALRVMLPGLLNNTVALLKDSALASTIGLLELSLAGSRVTSETFQPTIVLVTVALVYFAFSLIVICLSELLDRGYRWTR